MTIVGRTGSGKTTFARALFGTYRNLVVIDPKHRFELERTVLVVGSAREFAQVYPQRSTRVIYRPDPEDKSHDDVDQVIRRVLHYGRTCLLVDEAMLLSSPSWIVPAYKRAMVTGRELLVPVVSLTQRPVGVHNVIFSEAERVVIFDLGLEDDRLKVAGFTGDGARIRVGRPFAFLYYGPETAGDVVRCEPLAVRPTPSPGPPMDGGSASGPPNDRESSDGDGPRHRRHLRGEVGDAGVPRPRPR